MAIRSNNRTINFFSSWDESMKTRNSVNQPIFNRLLREDTALKVASLPEKQFPSGQKYFKTKAEERESVVVMHNNMIKGHDGKLKRFQYPPGGGPRLWLSGDA